MIDIESKVFDMIYNAVTGSYPSADVTTGYDEKTATFPCVVVEEANNVPYQKMNTDNCAENYSRVTYDISVYSDTQGKAKTEGKAILAVCDTAMQGLKFRRLRKNRPVNINRTIFRQYARYEVIVRQPITKGENTVYYLYRR